ncbi:MAG: hypothetical protein HQ518_11125 [Rhodopirellula sp.]|nr:hypothetical protein [Rhodopirellula sp.]
MASRLIYHTPQSMQGGVSPFDDAIINMVSDEDVRITCPYIGLEYLQRLTDKTREWWLITDIEELLKLQPRTQREAFADFIDLNFERVRHCQGLHAKVLIAGRQALVGSANMTKKGITRRVEMSVQFTECEQVSELELWFDDLWEQIVPFEPPFIRDFIDSLPIIEDSKVTTRLPKSFVGVWSRLSGKQPTSIAAEASDLIERLRMAPSREWANWWLGLAGKLIEVTELGPDDPRLSMSLPKDGSIAVTIIRRYVLAASLPISSTSGFGLILPVSMRQRIERMPNVMSFFCFRPGHSGETQSNAPLFVSFSSDKPSQLQKDIIEGWEEAAITECSHGRRSSFRKYHQPIVYRAATDDEFRLQLLDEAFPD